MSLSADEQVIQMLNDAHKATAKDMTEDEGFEFIMELGEEVSVFDEMICIALVNAYPNLRVRLKKALGYECVP